MPNPLNALRHHVTGAIERGEAVAIAGKTANERIAELKSQRLACLPEGICGAPALPYLQVWDASPAGIELLALIRAQSLALPAFKLRTYTLWTYDVWGNARDGFEVNDRSSHGTVEILCARETFNSGTVHEFYTWEPSDRQLSKAAGFRRAAWEWQEGSYTAEDSRNGRPIGELILEGGE